MPARRRRIGAVILAGAIAAVGVAAGTSLSSGQFTPVGQVQGAVGSDPGPSARPPDVAAAPESTPWPTPKAGSRATPRPTPVPTAVPTAPAPLTLSGYRWPLPRGRVTLPFGPSPWGSRIVAGEPFHDGVDLATFCGDRIVAAHDGTVLAAGRRYDQHMGWIGDIAPYLERLERKKLWFSLPIVVVIDDGNGYRSVYAHFSKVVVKKNAVVKAGQLLGYEGQTGRASGCHLHYGLFSPAEIATFGIDPDVVKRMKVPDRQIARIDPMLVLGERPEAPKAPKPTTPPAP